MLCIEKGLLQWEMALENWMFSGVAYLVGTNFVDLCSSYHGVAATSTFIVKFILIYVINSFVKSSDVKSENINDQDLLLKNEK